MGCWRYWQSMDAQRSLFPLYKFYDGMKSHVQDNGDISEAFAVTDEVKQGSVLDPILFCLVFQQCYRMYFITLRMEPASYIGQMGSYITNNDWKLLWRANRLSSETSCLLMTVSWMWPVNATCRTAWIDSPQPVTILVSPLAQKTEVMFQPAPGKPYLKPHITVNDTVLNDVEMFTYLGSTISRHVNIDEEITCRIVKASSAFGRLWSNVWNRRGISLTTKMKVYQAIVITMLLHAGESWTIYSRHARQLNKFDTSCLCKLLRIKWQDNIPDIKVLLCMGMPSIYTFLSKVKVRWAGHVSHTSNECLQKRLLYGKLLVGKCPVGRPKMHFKDSLKMSLKDLEIPVETWERLASNWVRWQGQISRGVMAAENHHSVEATHKWAKRKSRATSNM